MPRTRPNYHESSTEKLLEMIQELFRCDALGAGEFEGSITAIKDAPAFRWERESETWGVFLDRSEPRDFAAMKPGLAQAREVFREQPVDVIAYFCTTPHAGSTMHQAVEEAARLGIRKFTIVEGEILRKALLAHPVACEAIFGYTLEEPQGKKSDVQKKQHKSGLLQKVKGLFAREKYK